MDPTTELLCSTVHCLGIFPNDFHGPQACSFSSQPNLLFLLFIPLLFFLFIFFCFYSLITVPTQWGPCLHGPPCPRRSRETRPCGFADNDMNGHSGKATSPRTGTRGKEGGRGGAGGGGGGEKMERMERGGKDERREPRFNLYFSFSILRVCEGILSSLGGFGEKGRLKRGVGSGLNHRGQQEAKL